MATILLPRMRQEYPSDLMTVGPTERLAPRMPPYRAPEGPAMSGPVLTFECHGTSVARRELGQAGSGSASRIVEPRWFAIARNRLDPQASGQSSFDPHSWTGCLLRRASCDAGSADPRLPRMGFQRRCAFKLGRRVDSARNHSQVRGATESADATVFVPEGGATHRP